MTAIAGVGLYAPRWRIDAEAYTEAWGRFDAAGIKEKAVPGPDEDTLTMAVEAGRRALEAASIDGTSLDGLVFASSRPPMAEEDLTARIGEMLDLPATAARRVVTGSTRAGTQALLVGGGIGGRTLVTVADAPVGEPADAVDHAAGAGAAAFLLEEGGPLTLDDHAEFATVAPGTRFRGTGESETGGLGITQYDRTVFRETLSGALEELATEPEADAVALQAPDGKLPYRVADLSGLSTETIQAGAVVHDLGDLGAASVPVSLGTAVRDGHGRVLALSFGSGAGSDALVFSDDGVPVVGSLEGGESISYSEYLRLRGEITGDIPDGGGAYVSVPTWRRSIPQRYRLEAGRCGACGELAFPPSGACQSCGGLADYETVALPGTGTVRAVTTISQGGAPPEFAPFQEQLGSFPAGIVAFDDPDGDETVSVPVMGTGEEELSVGDRVRATIRRLYTQEGVRRYGCKVTALEE